jgi:phenylacetate-CoA ligase
MMRKFLKAVINGIKGDNFEQEYQEIKNIKTNEELIMFQEKYLKKLLIHAYENVPYYHGHLREIGVINEGKVDLSKFNQIPILTKEIMRKHHKELISIDYLKRKWYYNSSGGSTGEPIRFIQDDIYSKWGNVTNYYWYKDILGIDEHNVKKVFLWGSERDLFKCGFGSKINFVNWLNNTIFLNSFRLTEKDMNNYIKILNTYKPDLIRGYAGSLYELSRYAERKDKTIHTPKVIISTAETLTEEMREKIETIFGTKLYDFYGSRESNNLAGECKEGLMHILAFHNYVEILDDNCGPAKEGEEGRVIVTNLHNYSMPLIRYEIGDIAELGPDRCKCGNKLPLLRKVTGRITDHFIKEDGTIIYGEYFTHLFYHKRWIKSFQAIQEDYITIRVLIVPNGEVDEQEKMYIEDKIRLIMGKNCRIIWNVIDEIPKTPQGKYLYTKSLIMER